MSSVYENVVLRKLLDVFLELVQFTFASFVFLLEAHGVQFILVSQGLILFVDNLPLLFEGGDKFVLFLFVHEELCSIHLSLFFDLHFSN